MHDNLNRNEHVEAVHVDSSVFYDFNGRINPCYKALVQLIGHTFLNSRTTNQVFSSFRIILQHRSVHKI